jgi:oxalate decarboxylase
VAAPPADDHGGETGRCAQAKRVPRPGDVGQGADDRCANGRAADEGHRPQGGDPAVPLHNLWIFPGDEPGDLETDQVAAGVEWGSTTLVIFRMSEVKPVYENSGGSVRIADSKNFSASKTVAAALVVVKPGSMRELHWHPNADEWQYYMKGSARMTVFNTGPHANTTDFKAGDVGLVRRNCGHYVENTGDDDLVFIETFRSDHYEEVSLANWLSHLPPKLVAAHLNIPEETLAQFPRGAQGIVPLP